jgi:hypothetical protein
MQVSKKRGEMDILKKYTVISSLFLAAFVFTSIIAVFPSLAFGGTSGGGSATITVSYQNDPIAQISVSSPSVSLHVTDYTELSNTQGSATDSSVTYAVTTNAGGTAKITGSIGSAMESTLQLLATLGNAGGMSAGETDLTDGSSPTLVTGIPNGSSSLNSISIKFVAPITADRVTSSKTLTLTLLDS